MSGGQIPVTVTAILATPPTSEQNLGLLDSLKKYPYLTFAGKTSLYSYDDGDDDEENDTNRGSST